MATNPKSFVPRHVFDGFLEESEAFPIKRRYIGARDLRAVSENQVIGEPSQGNRTRSSFRLESNMALISEIQPECVDEALQIKVG